MDFTFTDEQNALRDSVQRFVRENYAFEDRRALAATEPGFKAEHWALMAELGWLALPFAEADGGLDGTIIDTMVVMEELGAGLVLEPYLASIVLAGGIIRRAASAEQKAAILPGVIDGGRRLALAHVEAGGRYNLAHVTATAQFEGGGYRIDGAKSIVLNGPGADWLIVTARTGGAPMDKDGISLFLVPPDADGLTLRAHQTQDGGRAAEVTLDGVRVGGDALLGRQGGGLPVLEEAIDEAIVALGAEAVGIMAALVRDTVEYGKTRQQFGRPIGSFQVLQHRMVDMFMETEQTRSLLYRAAMSMESGAPGAARDVSALKVQLGKAGRFVGEAAVQIHGGMGMTHELKIGHCLKRLTMINALFGNPDHHLRRFAELDGA